MTKFNLTLTKELQSTVGKKTAKPFSVLFENVHPGFESSI